MGNPKEYPLDEDPTEAYWDEVLEEIDEQIEREKEEEDG